MYLLMELLILGTIQNYFGNYEIIEALRENVMVVSTFLNAEAVDQWHTWLLEIIWRRILNVGNNKGKYLQN